MHIESFAKSDTGPQRSQNEDFVIADSELGLFVVCDGVGGSIHGKVASEHVGTMIRDSLRRSLKQGVSKSAGSEEVVSKQLEAALVSALQEACSSLSQMAKKDPKYSRMATTATALLISETRGYMAHVGDSRLYLLRGEKVHQLSRDHTIVAELIAAGQLSESQASTHPFAHVLTRSIGVHDSVQVDSLRFEVLPNDYYLLCSDGLTKAIEPSQRFASFLLDRSPEMAVSKLIEAANKEDGSDNVSVIVIKVGAKHIDRTAQRQRIALALMTIETLSNLSLFQQLTLEQILHVIGIAKVQNVDENFSIVEEGKDQHMMFVILEGAVAVTRQGVELARLGAGEHFGEMSLLNKLPRQATVTTTCPSQFLIIEHDRFQSLVFKNPQLGVPLLWRLASDLSLRLGKANEHL